MHIRYLMMIVVVTLLLLGACSGGTAAPAAPPVEEAMPEATAVEEAAAEETLSEEATPAEEATMDEAMATEEPAGEEAASEDAMAESGEEDAAAERPAWQQLPITNAQTGETFTLADFAGKTVYVEPFATWCTNCRQQLNHVNQARANFGDEVIFIALSVEPNIGDDALTQYAADQGFDLIFGAMSPELLRETVAIFGQTITNPPATPHFVIRADGSTTELFTGIEGPEEITNLITENQG